MKNEKLTYEYEDLMNTLENTKNSSSYQLKAVENFFKKYDMRDVYNKQGDVSCYPLHPLLMDMYGSPRKLSASRLKVMKALIAKGVPAEINTRYFKHSHSPIAIAVAAGDLQTTKLLLENGANPNIVGFSNHPILHTAVLALDFDLTKLLLKHKANPNIKYKEEIEMTAVANHSVLGYLYKYSIGYNTPFDHFYGGNQPKDARGKKGYINDVCKMVTLLHSKGASFTTKNGCFNQTLRGAD